MEGTQQVREFIEGHYSIGKAISLKKIDIGIANENFVVETASSRYVFRHYLHSLVQRKKEFVGLELGFMDFLGKKGLHVPKVVPQKDGSLFSGFDGSFACLFGFAEGKAELNPNEKHCFLAARETAKIRKHSGLFASETRPPDTGINLAFGIAEKLLQRNLGESDKQIISEEKKFLQGIPRNVEKGFIHGDVFPDNVLFRGGELAVVLDFELCYFGEYLLDLTNVLCSWCFTEDCFDFKKARKAIEGYTEIIKLPAKEKDLLYEYTRLSTFRVFVIRKQAALSGQKVIKPGNYEKRLQSLKRISKEQFERELIDACKN